jgi:chemotaxis protein methyltransferase CheR
MQQGLHWKLKQEIRDMVTFRFLNLAEPWGTLIPRADIIFLRNVLIYFDIETRKGILDRVRRLLLPEGRLLLGSAETTLNLDNRFERVNAGSYVCYRLKAL